MSCTIVPLQSERVARSRPLIDGWIAPEELYPTSYHREAVDGLPCGNRYRTACLRKIGRFFSDIVHLGLDPVATATHRLRARVKQAVDGAFAHDAERVPQSGSEKSVTFSQICVTYVCR